MKSAHLRFGNREYRFSALAALVFALHLFLLVPALTHAQADSEQQSGRRIKKDGITAYIVRDAETNSISLTMLIAHNSKLAHRIEKMVKRDVLPLTFSVSTLPGTSTYFDPTALVFEQEGKTWSPDSSALDSCVVILQARGKFGGLIRGGETQQAVILLPSWFNIDAPLYVRYTGKDPGYHLTEAN